MKIRSYTETESVEIDGGQFQLAPIPEGVWRNLALRSTASSRDARRRALIDLRGAGEEVDDGAVQRAMFLDPVHRRELEELAREAVAWGVRGHTVEGLAFTPGEREYFGRKYSGASDETVADYADTRLDAGGTLLNALYVAVHRKNSLDPAQKKSSPPPSDTTPDAGAAPTA